MSTAWKEGLGDSVCMFVVIVVEMDCKPKHGSQSSPCLFKAESFETRYEETASLKAPNFQWYVIFCVLTRSNSQ